MVSPTLTILIIMARSLAKQNEAEPRDTYQTWHQALRETLNQVALRLEIPFMVLLYNIFPFWLPNFVQAEYSLDEQQTRLYVEAMKGATISEILGYLMAVGLHIATCSTHILHIYPESKELAASDPICLRPSGSPTIEETTRTQRRGPPRLDLLHLGQRCRHNASPGWKPCSQWRAQPPPGFPIPLADCYAHAGRNGRPDTPYRPHTLANLSIFGAVMTLRYPTQVLWAAANAPTLSILHFVISDGYQLGPTYQRAVNSFASLRSPMAYTIIKDRKQVEHNFVSITRARARCALPISMEFHPIAWLHIPQNPETGAAHSFADWNAEIVLRVLATIVQRLGGRERSEEPSELRYLYVCDTSRIYCDRTSPRAYPARILQTTTCWSKPELVDLAVHQIFQRIKAKTTSVGKEPN